MLVCLGCLAHCSDVSADVPIRAGENHLSFIETSALDASNVELAFQNILTGTFAPEAYAKNSGWLTLGPDQRSTESYPARRSTAATAPRRPSAPVPTSP